jgi:hypothetical protein
MIEIYAEKEIMRNKIDYAVKGRKHRTNFVHP